jgi:hypothetical protein
VLVELDLSSVSGLNCAQELEIELDLGSVLG